MANPDVHAAQSASTESQSGPTERHCNGRFAACNRGGSGNPFARRVAELRSAFIETVTPDDLQEICQRLICQAVEGNVAAARLVLGYVLGKVPEPVNPDTVDQEEVRMYSQNLSMSELQEAQHVSPPRVSLAMLRATSMIREENASAILCPEQETPFSAASPSANGPDGASSPSANGPDGASPSANGGNGGPARKRKPSPFWKQALPGKQANHGQAS